MQSKKPTRRSLTKVATYRIPNPHPFNLIIARGSVVDFEYGPNRKFSAIVNAANERCLGGGSVDGAISVAGGKALQRDREALPEILGVRCPTGQAVITGPNSYGKLNTGHVIHAVGPNYHLLVTEERRVEGDELLSLAYTCSLQRGRDAKLEAIAFSLLSAGTYRGSRTLDEVLAIGMEAICKFDGYGELKDVYMCAFNQFEADALVRVAANLGLVTEGNDEDVGSFGSGLITAATCNRSGSRGNTSSIVPLIEAFAVVAEPTYDAVQVDVNTDEKCHLIRLKRGQCPTCGMETHTVSGLLKKKYNPISNKYVLNGRCLICKPINSDTLKSSTLNTSAVDISDENPGGLGHMNATFEATEDSGNDGSSRDKSNDFRFNLDEEGVKKDPDMATDTELPSSGSYKDLDVLGRLVKRAAVNHDMQFRSSTGDMIPCDLHLQNPVTPSDLTLDTYFRRNMISIKNEPLAKGDAHRTYPIAQIVEDTEPQSSGSYENLDMLGRLVKRAAVDHDLQFRSSTGDMIPCDLRLQNPVTPSDLTLDTYFRRNMISIKNEPLAKGDAPQTYPIDHEINTTRLNLSAVVECITTEPVQLTQKYVEMIKTDTVIGGGYFGEVRLGMDKSIGVNFAVKSIKPLVIEQALSSQLQSIQKSFQNEIKVLSRLRHPNIAPLYGYCMEGSDLQNTCLLYEFAANGSLDKFWATEGKENRLSRERLSDPLLRVKIALEVATVLRYMHEGLSGKSRCFHRDIKSANICLCSDFSARVVDCGLAKYVTEEVGSFSTAGPSGTPGYTCPQYLQGEISFCSACDVFSLGVVMCELITGRLSVRSAQHYSRYKKGSKSERLIGDADDSVDWGSNDNSLCPFAKLALKCMRFTAKKRPSIARVVNELSKIVYTPDNEDFVSKEMLAKTADSAEYDFDSTDDSCLFCGEICEKSIKCTGGSEYHRQCHNCMQRALRRNMCSFQYGRLSCLKEGCNSRQFQDEEVASLVSSDLWESYSNQRSSDLFQMIGRNLNRVEANVSQMQRMLVQLSAGNGLPCPRLFVLLPEEPDGNKAWGKPMAWTKNMTSVKLYLHFVCSHSLQPVSDKCRIKLRYKRDWMRAIAPALNLSLDIIKLGISVLVGHEVPIPFSRIKEMDDWCKEMLDPTDRSALEEASQCGLLSSEDMGPKLRTLTGNSLSKVAEKAASSNVNWQSELVPVYDYEKKEPTFVMKEFASDYRYHREGGIFTAG